MARSATKPKKTKSAAKRSPRKTAAKKAAGTGKKAKPKSKASAAALAVVPSADLVLPEALDSSSAEGIRELLLKRRGSPLIVDAGQVRRTGMQAVQILIAAARTWQTDGQSYVVANPTTEFLDTLARVGLSREHLLIEGSPV